jgi:8-oxo-dGTP pyrophosphatase MutT (NUDIX family)
LPVCHYPGKRYRSNQLITNVVNTTPQIIRETLEARSRTIIELPQGWKQAAVLMPFYLVDNSWYLLLTKRTVTVATHKGQISFPGGGIEPQDENLLQTALRESEEEIGLAPQDVEILGVHDDIRTVTDFVVTPYVGIIPHPYQFNTSEHEIDELIFVSLERLFDPSIFRKDIGEFFGQKNYKIYYFDYDGHIIWGATAKILVGFFKDVFGWREPE